MDMQFHTMRQIRDRLQILGNNNDSFICQNLSGLKYALCLPSTTPESTHPAQKTPWAATA